MMRSFILAIEMKGCGQGGVRCDQRQHSLPIPNYAEAGGYHCTAVFKLFPLNDLTCQSK